MVRVLVFVAACLASSASALADAFCEGYQAGYRAGYCYQQLSCINPIPPICPMPDIGERSFQDGYNRGLLAGMAERS